MGGWQKLSDDVRQRWNANAENWDKYMGTDGNRFHLELVRPAVEELLGTVESKKVLDVGCGNGNFSRRLADRGARVVGIDLSCRLIERARSRLQSCDDRISYRVVDATDFDALMGLGERSFDEAVANMVLMDMWDLQPLAAALRRLLKPGGCLVFSVLHPCFRTPDVSMIYQESDTGGNLQARRLIQLGQYIQPQTCKVTAIPGEKVPSRYFHRPLHALLDAFFDQGFALDGLREPVFCSEKDRRKPGFEWIDIPPLLVCRLRVISDYEVD